jgi:hypothetical protein
MQRRNFLVGIGSASVGGSALLGSGAFSRVESQRSVTVQVAEDPDAYLGLNKCNTPNGSYTSLDGSGHLEVLMNPDNETIGSSPLGSGINSNSTSRFDRVFQICNQGKQSVCVHIEDSEAWPRVPESDAASLAGERRVEFYLEDDAEASAVGESSAFGLDVGECVCVGILTRSYGLQADDELLDAIDNEIRIIADVDGDCFEEVIPEVPFYGTSRSDPTGIYSIRGNGGGSISEAEIGTIPDESSNSNYPNGLAYDPGDEVWYFAEKDGILKTLNEGGTVETKVYGSVTGGDDIAGAAFYDGTYYFIPNGGDTLQSVDVQSDANYGTTDAPAGGVPSPSDVAELEWTDIGLGDLAVDRTTDVLYVSTTNTGESGANFFSVDLNDTGVQTQIVSEDDGDRTEVAIRSQIAFDQENRLWAHNAGNGEWRIADLTDGALGGVVTTTRQYTDLAQSGANSVE